MPASSVPATMRAVELTGYGGLDKLIYRTDVPTPKPSPEEVLVKVGACGVNNTDINLRTRWYHRAGNASLTESVAAQGIDLEGNPSDDAQASWQQQSVGFPRIQGAAVAGRIAAVGEKVDSSRIGERVVVDPQIRDLALPPRAQLIAYLGGERDGGFAEYVAVPAANAHMVDTRLTDAELATFPTSYDTAEEMLDRARLATGETILITGAAGGVGTALIQLAQVRGARVIAVAGRAKEQRLRELGAQSVIPRETENLQRAVEATHGAEAIDVVADVVGGEMFGELLKLLRRGGRYVSAGAIAGPIQPIDLRDLIYKDLEMYGVTCPTPDAFRRVLGYAASGQIRPLLDRTFALQDLRLAQAELAKRTHVGKFAVVP